MNDIKNIYEECYTIRVFEKMVGQAFLDGKLRGTTHACIGEEIIPVLVSRLIDKENDYVVGTHRCHGDVLAYTNDPYSLISEMMGKKDGFVKGMGGSQHIKVGRYLTNGVTGGMAAIAVGIAVGIKKQNKKGCVVAFMGDGAFNEGYVQETLNLSSIYGAPCIYICENNKYAMSTCTSDYSAGTFENRIKALNMKYICASTADIEEIQESLENAFSYVRNSTRPIFVEINTARLCGHSKSDKMEYMSTDERNQDIKNDPIRQMERDMSIEKIDEIKKRVEEKMKSIFEEAYIK